MNPKLVVSIRSTYADLGMNKWHKINLVIMMTS